MTALSLRGVGVTRDGRAILDQVDWDVEEGERWVVLGPNGSGKTTLVQIASFRLHPTCGHVEVLGQQLGRVNVWKLRDRIGLASASLADQLRPDVRAVDVVVTAKHGALEPWWHTYSDDERAAATECLVRMGVGHLAERTIGTLSSGERQRVLLARTLLGEPGVVILDEPTAGLDLGGREEFVRSIAAVAADPKAPPMIFVTHHVEEIPPGFTSLLLLKEGRIVAKGPIEDTLTADALGDVFGVPLRIRHEGGRWSAVGVVED